ncbi:GNAT family N-acetyltransferase [Rhizobium rhizosphaerae]|uniref:GNAT family N-acetyltransferase n=1 Tax=Xaviernesmea rhizosphaerae TaxID=1672749 RepID=A0A1Q9AN32_9HYPH|nr:GNAT family N-acetyltransferase [Xaviernesmea rhizosphaerae]OLP56736.1 GNAT family N-acetyltransferase [Xaviernesmea rhizosphaerae]
MDIHDRRERFEVRGLREQEIVDLLALYRHLDPQDAETRPADALARWRALKTLAGSDILVGCLEGRLVASCTMVLVPNITRGGRSYALIENVVTDGAYRQRGFGRAVLHATAERAWEAGCYKVMLMTGSKRPEVHRFYERAGFVQNKTGFQMRRLERRSE